MARTTPALVATIVKVSTTFANLTPFIDSANELVTEVCASVKNKDGSDYYTPTRLELIERWLAAHFYKAGPVEAVASEQAGPVQQSFQYKLGLNLAVTKYGQQAMLLDTMGGLAALNKASEEGRLKRASVAWLGKEVDEV